VELKKIPEFPLWTSNKALLIAEYLRLFVNVTRHGNYIDGFAGPQNASRTGWAAELVLGVQLLQNFYLCDLLKKQVRALRQLKAAHPDRNILIYDDDFNVKVDEILQPAVLKQTQAAFCLIDQRTFECKWQTLVKLAGYKPAGTPKIELFYFLAQSWLDRAFSGLRATGVPGVDAWWGGPGWKVLRGQHAWQRALLFCERFRNELGYLSVKPWAIYEHERGGKLMYHMIHATDHPEAPKLMERAYEGALVASTGAAQTVFPI
jgi:three-Cys-motif partner protein